MNVDTLNQGNLNMKAQPLASTSQPDATGTIRVKPSLRIALTWKYLALLVLPITAAALFAGEPNPAKPPSPEFERMKSLAGTWKGKADMGQGLMEFTVEYRLISGGSAIEERIFADTPKEMVTMYNDQNGKLALTHYCMLGNRPGMVVKSTD